MSASLSEQSERDPQTQQSHDDSRCPIQPTMEATGNGIHRQGNRQLVFGETEHGGRYLVMVLIPREDIDHNDVNQSGNQ